MNFRIKRPVSKLLLVAGLAVVALVSTAQSDMSEIAPNLIIQEGVGGSVTHTQSGNEFMLTAIPGRGYIFDSWQCISSLSCRDELDGNTASEVSFVSTIDVVVRAEFVTESKPTLTVMDADNGVVVTSCAPDCSGEPGWLAQVRAVPNVGFTFSEWACEGDCSRVARTDAELFLRVSDDVTLTPRYTEISDTVLELRGAEGSNVSVVVECGTDCLSGGGWTSYLNPKLDEGYALDGWQCEGVGSCPAELTNSESLPIRLSVTERHVIKPDVIKFQIVSDNFLNHENLSSGVVDSLICGEQTDCVYVSSGDTVRLGVDTPSSLSLDYEWELVNNVDGLLLTDQSRNEILVEVSDDLSEIITAEIVVEPVGANAAMLARDTINVVAVPSAFAVQVGTLNLTFSDFEPTCSGFILRDRDDYFVVTAGHCIDGSDLSGNRVYAAQIGTSATAPILRGADVAYDEISDLGVFRIPDSNLAWVPDINSAIYPRGENVTVVGIARTRALTGESSPQLSVTEGSVINSELCRRTFNIRDFSVPGYSRDCSFIEMRIQSSVSSVRGSGSPIINSELQVVGVVAGGAVRSGVATTRGAFLRGFSSLDPLLMGYSRCIISEIDERGGVDRVGVKVCDADAEQ